MAIELLIHNFGYICSALITIALGLFILLKDPKKRTYQLFFLSTVSYVLYAIAYVLSVNIEDSGVASVFAFLMVIAATIPCFHAHLAFATFGIEKEHKRGLTVMYSCFAAVFAFFIANPYGLRLQSIPKAYFPNFFQPGPYYWIYFLFFFGVLAYYYTVLIKYYKKADKHEQNRLKYYFAGFTWAYVWSLPIYMLIWNIPGAGYLMVFTPLLGLYTLPLAYGVYKYDLLNINIAIKNALLYGFFVVFVGGSVILINALNGFLTKTYNKFPIWIVPVSSVFLVLLVSVIVWNQLRQADLLKYEFINNISHKFRTPLTHIRWLASELKGMNDPIERERAGAKIDFASMRLFELTNAVINASRDVNPSVYRFASVKIHDLIADIRKAHEDQVEAKRMNVEFKFDNSVMDDFVLRADRARLQFALQILYENALMYTPAGGHVTVSVSAQSSQKEIVITFKDDGIGIKDSDISHVFSRFFRAINARRTDTEGMGLGLFIAKDIIEKHGGRIWAESDGENKGSTFSVALQMG